MMISVADALAQVLAGVEPLNAERVGVANAFGRVLAEDVASRLTQPSRAVSAMDGYAVRAEDVRNVPATLTRIGESAAGNGYDGGISAGQTVRIFTGAPVPDGADAIVIQEDTETDGDKITMTEAPTPGRYIRSAGLDFAEGDVLLARGRRMTARDVSLAAAMNVPWLTVTRKPRIALLSTGDELVLPGEPVGPDQIISSNSIGLGSFIQAMGGEAVNLGIARDDPDDLRRMLDGVRGADMLVTIGGASVGDYDLVKTVLGGEGLDITFSTVAMRPGKPLIFGAIHGKPMLGLPGNPVSAGVTSVLFLRPAIGVMLGLNNDETPRETALLGRDVPANDHRQDYLRSTLGMSPDGELTATPFKKQDSSMLRLFAQSDCLVVRPPNAPPLAAGERVDIVRLDWSNLSV